MTSFETTRSQSGMTNKMVMQRTFYNLFNYNSTPFWLLSHAYLTDMWTLSLLLEKIRWVTAMYICVVISPKKSKKHTYLVAMLFQPGETAERIWRELKVVFHCLKLSCSCCTSKVAKGSKKKKCCFYSRTLKAAADGGDLFLMPLF